MGIAGAGLVAANLAGCSSSSKSSRGSTTSTRPGIPTTPSTVRPAVIRKPGSRPNPTLPEGTDTMPKIEHIVVVMQENHSYDSYFGALAGRGDGFKLDAQGKPLDANPDGKGGYVKAFHMPSECQISAHPGQNWVASHASWNRGKNDGFVTSASGPVSMGYWDETDLPFYYSLAKTFALQDRWFCSVLAQTYPNRRFLLAGTAAGIVSTTTGALTASPPPNGSIFDRLDAHSITWKDYYTDLPGTLVLASEGAKISPHTVKIDQFFTDAAAGKLPAVSFVDPNFEQQSEENPQDISRGENFSAKVINAVLKSPTWEKTALFFCYDEHGGYYDHVAPPPAIKPDNIPPGADAPAPGGYGYDNYGFRVPAVIVSPYAKKDYVSSVVHDQTSILKFIETKWNLGAMTYRDANADNLFDSFDFDNPAFMQPPALATPHPEGTCKPGNAGGPIPPPAAVVPQSQASELRIGAT
jgi:phospholipase C